MHASIINTKHLKANMLCTQLYAQYVTSFMNEEYVAW